MNRFQCLLFVFSSTQFMAYGSLKICDKSQNISIDSALTKVNGKGDKVLTLFSGEEVYELEPLDVNKRPVITSHQKLSDMSPNLSPPITISFFDWKIILYNDQLSKEWRLLPNRSLDSEKTNTEWKRYFESIVFNAKNTFLSIKTINIGKIIALDSNETLVQSQVNGTDQIRLVKEDQSQPKTGGFSELNGIAITSAFVLDNNVWHLMAGRMLCRMKIHSYKWLPMCEIEDISDWIDCNQSLALVGTTAETTSGNAAEITTEIPTESTTKSSATWNPIYLIVVAVIVFIIIVVIVLAIIVYFCRNKKNAKTEAKTESIASKPKTESIASKPKTESIATQTSGSASKAEKPLKSLKSSQLEASFSSNFRAKAKK